MKQNLKITLYDFSVLSTAEQIDILYANGVYIGKTLKEDMNVVLYQLDAFYVEIYYRKYRCLVQRVRCFTSTMCLNPYLENMDVAELINC